MTDEYKASDFRVGQRVQTHPATDLFMRGVRYGNVTYASDNVVRVRFDNLPLVRKILARNLLPIE